MTQRVAQTVTERRVFEFTAASGVGKSSFLAAGLIPMLSERYGRTCVLMKEWAWAPGFRQTYGDRGPEAFLVSLYAAAIRQRLNTQGWSDENRRLASDLYLDEPWAYLDELEERLGRDLVIVYDQFEELLRDDQALGRALLRTVAVIAKHYSFRHVITMRSEFRVEFKAIEENLSPSEWKYVDLKEIDDGGSMLRIIEQPMDSGGPSWIDETARQAVVNAWYDARRIESEVGLVQFQATLWVLYEEWKESAGTGDRQAFKVEALRDIAERWARLAAGSLTDHSGGSLAVLHRLSLHRYLERKLGLPDVESDTGRRRMLHLAARSADHLSSAGYKLSLGINDLLRRSVPELEGQSKVSPRTVELAVAAAADAARESPHLIADSSRLAAATAERLLAETTLLETERENLLSPSKSASGDLFGKSALDVLAQTAADFERLITEMRTSYLIRVTPSSRTGRRVALVHDSYGEAFILWARRAQMSYLSMIDLPFELIAGSISRRPASAADAETDDPQSRYSPLTLGVSEGRDVKRLDGLRWVSCILENTIVRNVEFARSSLSATFFEKCRFENVRFTECDLRGALFIGCTFADCVFDGALYDEPRGSHCALSSLVFRACTATEGTGLEFRAQVGMGLFIEEFSGAVSFIDTTISHVFVSSDDKGPVTVRVERSTLDHLTLVGSGSLALQTDITSTIQWFERSLGVTVNGSEPRPDGTSRHVSVH